MKKIAIVSTHPIQYNAPWMQLLHGRGRVQVKVFYTWAQPKEGLNYDQGFGRLIKWDIPLLDGYEHLFTQTVHGIEVKKLVEDWHPDAILVIGWRYKGHFACMRYFKGKIPVLFRGDSTLTDEKINIKTVFRRIFLSFIYRYIDVALYVGTNNKNYFLAHGLTERQLYPAFHAVDNDRFSQNHIVKNDAQELRQNLGISPNDFVVLFAGKLEKKKNPLVILELAKLIKDKEIVFLVTGNGKLEREFKNRAVQDPRIKFLDFQNQSKMPAVYAAADLLLLPSTGPGETWGLVANEAMACALPIIISSKAGGAIDLVNENGIIVDPEDVGRMSKFIEEVKNDKKRHEKLKMNSLQHIQNFNFTQIVEGIERACGL